MRVSPTSSTRLTLHANPPKYLSNIFLNCTKNAELTAHPFARTVTLALSQKMKQNSVDDRNRLKTVGPIGDSQSAIKHHHSTPTSHQPVGNA